MTSGIRAEICLPTVSTCPLTELIVSGPPIYSLTRSYSKEAPETVTVECILDNSCSLPDSIGFTQVFDYGTKTAYRFTMHRSDDSPFERIEQHGVPVAETIIRDGKLFLTFHATDLPVLRSILDSLREVYTDLQVQRLLQSSADASESDLIQVDRSQLTERQREVLNTAYEMGYFTHPKGANAGEVAASLGIDQSTFTEHLAAAQRKILGSIVDSS